jgi:predicted RNA-binding protein with PUA-like domain
VDVKLVRRLKRLISLEELKRHKEGQLGGMVLFRQSRLSVQPVTQAEWDLILSLEEQEPRA